MLLLTYTLGLLLERALEPRSTLMFLIFPSLLKDLNVQHRTFITKTLNPFDGYPLPVLSSLSILK